MLLVSYTMGCCTLTGKLFGLDWLWKTCGNSRPGVQPFSLDPIPMYFYGWIPSLFFPFRFLNFMEKPHGKTSPKRIEVIY